MISIFSLYLLSEFVIIWCSYSDFILSTCSARGQNCTGMCTFISQTCGHLIRGQTLNFAPHFSQLQVRGTSPSPYISLGCEEQIENVSYRRYRNQFRKAKNSQDFVINNNKDNNYNNVQPVFLVSFFERQMASECLGLTVL